MRISGFSADEFETLRGVKGTLAPRLSVIWGGNESGKTTLLRFFRSLMSARGNGEPTPGKGTLLVRMSGGDKKLIGDASGADGSIDAAAENFLPFSAEYYESVFCIGPGKGQKNAFAAAEADLEAGAFLRFMNFTKKLDELERSLFSPNHPGSSLSRAWAEIESNNLRIESLQKQYPVYWELRETWREKREALKNARRSLEKNRSALARAELTAKARPYWVQVRELEAELASLGPARSLPQRGLERLNSLSERIAGLRTRLDEQRRKSAGRASLRRQMENSPIMTILKYGDILESLEREMGNGILTEAEKAALSANAASAGELLKRELMEIVPHWSEEDLAAADFSPAAERHGKNLCDAVRDFKERFEKLQSEKNDVESKFAALQTAAGPSGEEDSGEFADYQARRELLLAARRDLFHQDALRWEIRGEKACAELIEKEIKSDSSPPQRTGNYMAKFLLAVLFSMSGIAVAFGAVAPEFRAYSVYAVFFCIASALIPFFSILMSRKEHLARLAHWKAGYARRNGELDGIDEKIVERRREMQAIDASMEQKAQVLGLGLPLTLSGLDEAVRLLENEYHVAANLELRKAARKQLAEDLKKCGAGLAKLKETLAGAKRELDGALKNWSDWLLQNRFSPELAPESFGPFWAGVIAARADLKALNGVRLKLAEQREYDASIDARIDELNAKTGLGLDRTGLTAVFTYLKEARSLQERINASLEERRIVDLECSELEKELAAAVGGVRALCEEAGADGEEELRAMLERESLRSSLENRLAESERALTGICGDAGKAGENPAGISGPEFSADGLTLAGEAEVLKMAAADDEKNICALHDEIRGLEDRMEPADPDGLFALRQRNETLKIGVKKEFQRWLSAVLLKRFTGRAAERQGNKLEPDTLRQARQFLSLMTGHGWKFVPDGCRVALERETDGTRLDETQWSSGLAEQAWLSMRLAVAYRLAERLEPVPIMLDDVLTSFDENRQQGAAEALWLASEKTQVIFFTCHRSTVEMFRSRLGDEKDFSVFEMPKRRRPPRAKPR